MSSLAIAVGALVAYLVAYNTYGRWLSRKIFKLDPNAVCPSVAVNDGRDYVPTRREIVFGHHFTSIAGTGPIVGPAIAVFWGWLPALLWVVIGSIFMGAVHDMGALVVSLRSRGMTVGDIAGRVINRRARILFLVVLFLTLMVVIGIFGLVIATIFATYPSSVFPIWIQIPIAITVGVLVYKRGWKVAPLALGALVLMYVSVWVGAYVLPIDLGHFGFAPTGTAAQAAGHSPYANAVVIWTLLLLVYCFFASVLPVWVLLQPRDFINSQQLFVAMALLVAGLLIAPLLGQGMELVAKPINPEPPPGSPPMIPFLFITIACGAISGFHCLVSSGTSSKQIRNEQDAHLVGYGAMLLESALAVLVILACSAGLSRGVYEYHPDTYQYVHRVDATTGQPLVGYDAWARYYTGKHWTDFKLKHKVGGFIEGGANMLHTVGIPITFGIGIMAVLVACFAATTLDTATRLQRYVITELMSALRLAPLTNKYAATTIAVVTGGALAMIAGPAGPGSGGLILWPIFGVSNQLLAGLSFLVIAFFLLRYKRPVWFLVGPMVIMIVLPAWVMMYDLPHWFHAHRYVLFGLGLVITIIQVWMVIEAALLWRKVRGVAPEPLPPLPSAAGTAATR